MQMDLDYLEVELVKRHRRDQEQRAVKAAKQALCTHPDRRYSGHSHNDDVYECTQCGDIEWR